MTIYIVDLEAVDTRYTKEWKEHLPKQLQRASNQSVVTISGGDTPQATTPGAFLNFGGTNVYKSAQMEKIQHAKTVTHACRYSAPNATQK